MERGEMSGGGGREREEGKEGKRPDKGEREVGGRAGKGRGERGVASLVRINPCCLESIRHQQIL